jgi:hypothetical protein
MLITTGCPTVFQACEEGIRLVSTCANKQRSMKQEFSVTA